MKILSAKNPVKTGEKSIDLEVLFYELESDGYIHFTATPSDPEDHGRELYARATAGEFGPVK